MRIFENRTFAVQNVVLGVASMAFIPVFFFASTYGQISLGQKATTSSLAILYFFIGFVVFAQIGGRMLDRAGAKRPVVIGCVLATIGFALWAGKVTDLNAGSQTLYIVISGAGMGLMLGQSNTDAINRASRYSYGEATGITQTVRNYGASLGFAILGTILINRFRSEITSSLTSRGMPGPAAAAEASKLAQLQGGGSSSTATIPQFIRADFASAIEVVLYGMAIIMGIAALVALRGLSRGVQQETPAAAADRDRGRALPATTAGPLNPRIRSMRPTLYEFAGGEQAFAPFAAALHARCLADPELNHPFSHPGQNPQHVERLAAYLAEAMGGPPRYSGEYGGDQTALLLLHAGNGDMSDLGRRFADCFMLAADDAGWPDDPEFRAAIRGYIDRSVDVVALSHPHDTDIPADLPIPHWSWDGPAELPSLPGHVRLDAVQDAVDAEQELLALRRRPARRRHRRAVAGVRRRPGDPVQPRVGRLVRQLPQQRVIGPGGRPLLLSRRDARHWPSAPRSACRS